MTDRVPMAEGRAHQVRWRPWGSDAFAEAQREDKPILLCLSASWCHWCRIMDETSYSDPEIVRSVSAHFVPIQVDSDRRPDLNDRYNMGGLPSTAFLTPTGDTLTGATYIAPQELRHVLQQVEEVYHHRRQEVYQRIEEAQAQATAQEEVPTLGSQVTGAVLEEVTQAILGRFDPQYGGFDTMPKFPAPEVIDLLLFRHRLDTVATLNFATVEPDPSGLEGYVLQKSSGHLQQALEPSDPLLGIVEMTLDGMAQGALFDQEEGGFYRYADGVDWTQPHSEKHLEINAALLSNYLHLYQVTGEERHARVAGRLLSYMNTVLFDPETGAFRGSQAADEAYYALEGQARQQAPSPPVDATIYTDSAARAASAYLSASWLLERPSCQKRALGCLEFLWQRMRTAEGGLYHYFDGAPHVEGLLRDHVYLLRALLDACQVTGKEDYLNRALELAGVIERDFKDGAGPGYFDLAEREEGMGYLRYRRKPLAENAAQADALLTLHYLTEAAAYRERAQEVLDGFVPLYAKHGHFAAGYAQAVARLLTETIQFHVVGRAKAEGFNPLIEACLRQGYPNAVVRVLDPERDAELIKEKGYSHLDHPVVYVCAKTACAPPTAEAGALEETVVALLQPVLTLAGPKPAGHHQTQGVSLTSYKERGARAVQGHDTDGR